MTIREESSDQATFPIRVAARMTGLKPELIRAWESRYGAVRPTRSAGGSRRYTKADLRRLSRLRDVVAAGHRIGGVARLDLAELHDLLYGSPAAVSPAISELVMSVERLDAFETRGLLVQLMSEQGPVEFATRIALPLLAEIGQRWRRGDLSISVEHFATGIVRSILMPVIGNVDAERGGPKVVFATPSGEPHDIGTLVAALLAVQAGVEVIFLGADVPVDDLVQSVVDTRASAIVIGIVTLPKKESEQSLRDLRDRLPEDVGVWIGGPGIAGLAPLKGIERITNLEQLDMQMTLMADEVADESVRFVLSAGARK